MRVKALTCRSHAVSRPGKSQECGGRRGGHDERRRTAYIPVVTEISTPCISVCVLDPKTGLCEGCGRTLDEIARWLRMSEPERKGIMAELAGRRRRTSPPRDERP
jgi:uncharacterized protein